MHRPLLVGLLACVVIAGLHSKPVHAEALDSTFTGTSIVSDTGSEQIAKLTIVKPEDSKSEVAPEPAAPQPVVHTVVAGETLSSIATQHGTDWHRLFNKNVQIASPDILHIGDQITVPKDDEQLAVREVQVAPPPAPVSTSPAKAPVAQTASMARGSSTGNTYTYGYCTWYAKNMRPDMPNNLGNAYTWVSRAAAQGFATGSAPQVGAIAQEGNHVAYVQSVNGDGTVTVSEMNYVGWNIVSTRTAPASNFLYIY